MRLVQPKGLQLRANEVTRILSDLQHGDPHAAAELLPLVYEELRKLAAQRMAAERPARALARPRALSSGSRTTALARPPR